MRIHAVLTAIAFAALACGSTPAQKTPEQQLLEARIIDWPFHDTAGHYDHLGMRMPADFFGGYDDGPSGDMHFTRYSQDRANVLLADLWFGTKLPTNTLDEFEAQVVRDGLTTLVKRETDGHYVIHAADAAKHQVTVFVTTWIAGAHYLCRVTSPARQPAMPSAALIARLESICASPYDQRGT